MSRPDPTDSLKLGWCKGLSRIDFANTVQKFGANVPDHNSLEQIELGAEVVKVTSGTATNIEPGVSLLDWSEEPDIM
jgi:hypothetical protein